MKLEIKHLAPYLPYGLNGIFSDLPKGKTFEVTEIIINKGEDNSDEYIYVSGTPGRFGGHTTDIYYFKSILRQISDLNQNELSKIIDHIFRDSKGVRPKKDSVKQDKGCITFYDLNTMQTYVAVKPSSDGTPLLNMSNCFDDYSVFFELHVDMFNLIKKGLAIDINALPELLNT